MTTAEEDARNVNAVAALLDGVATQLEKLMPLIRQAREALSENMPGVARFASWEGSVEALDMATAEGLGYARVEAARLRLLAILQEPTDDVPRS